MSDGNEYVVGHLEEALAQTGETDVRVLIETGQLRITGNVTTEHRRAAIGALASNLVENLDVRNEVTVLSPREPSGPETIS
jgi:hypothetical protein